jgi:hypothetical protein
MYKAHSDRWRSRAEELRPYAAPAAEAFVRAAFELEEAMREAADEELTLAEAARESGYSERRLRELVKDGDIPNAGRKGAPRLRRADRPRKGRKPAEGSYDAQEHATSILSRMRGAP